MEFWIHLVKTTQRSHVTTKKPSANATEKINHSSVGCKSVKMVKLNVLILVFLATLVTLIGGFKIRAGQEPTPEECLRPHAMIRPGHECCRLPKERIWGDLKKSFQLCSRKIKLEATPMRQEMGDAPEMSVTPVSEPTTPMDTPSESASTPASASPFTTPAPHNRVPHWKKRLSEKLKHLISTVYKEIKGTIDALWQSVVIITDHHFRRRNDSCFIECIFEDQGFLMDKMVNKGALLERLALTLAGNEPWYKVATEAVETCYEAEMATPSNATCNSKSEEVFRCVFKQLFLNCPNWSQDEYCTSMKEFYQKCPNGPPPEIEDNHSTTAAPEDTEEDPSTEGVTETGSEPPN